MALRVGDPYLVATRAWPTRQRIRSRPEVARDWREQILLFDDGWLLDRPGRGVALLISTSSPSGASTSSSRRRPFRGNNHRERGGDWDRGDQADAADEGRHDLDRDDFAISDGSEALGREGEQHQ